MAVALKDRPTAIGLVTAASAAHFGTPNILSRDRHKTVALARQVALYICRSYVRPTPSYPELGRWFGLDHSTVMAAVRRIERRRPELDLAIREIRQAAMASGAPSLDRHLSPASPVAPCSSGAEACS